MDLFLANPVSNAVSIRDINDKLNLIMDQLKTIERRLNKLEGGEAHLQNKESRPPTDKELLDESL